MTWRVGRSVGNNIYRMVGDEPSKSDSEIGVFFTPADAAAAVDAFNRCEASAVLPNRDAWARPVGS